MKKKVVIIGAGPAGLTAAYELSKTSGFQPIVYESNSYVGGLSATVSFKGNKIDLGPHRFFSKSKKILDWWFSFLPLSRHKDDVSIFYQNASTQITKDSLAPDPEKVKDVMLLVKRKTRIFYQGKFYDYPISLSYETLSNLGIIKTLKILIGYIKSKFRKRVAESNLEDFFINRFGDELYQTFFKSYTEKVWGVDCRAIPADWGVQRVKGMSLSNAFLDWFTRKVGLVGLVTKEASLIEHFLYPRHGAGHMWEVVAKKVRDSGVDVKLNTRITGLNFKKNKIVSYSYISKGKKYIKTCGYLISTAPIDELIKMFSPKLPQEIRDLAAGLKYRSLVIAVLIIPKNLIAKDIRKDFKDNWIYMHDPSVLVGRIQIVNNLSKYMIKSQNSYVLGMEYYCNESDEFWKMSDNKILKTAKEDLEKIQLIKGANTVQGKIVRVKKAYPSYVGNSYKHINKLQKFVDKFTNLYLVGRNGMHRYNNQDHSMLAAMKSVESIIDGGKNKNAIWKVNEEDEYHEVRKDS